MANFSREMCAFDTKLRLINSFFSNGIVYVCLVFNHVIFPIFTIALKIQYGNKKYQRVTQQQAAVMSSVLTVEDGNCVIFTPKLVLPDLCSTTIVFEGSLGLFVFEKL